MTHFYPVVNGLFQDDSAPIQRTQRVTEWFDEYENDVNRIRWPSEHFRKCLYEHISFLLNIYYFPKTRKPLMGLGSVSPLTNSYEKRRVCGMRNEHSVPGFEGGQHDLFDEENLLE